MPENEREPIAGGEGTSTDAASLESLLASAKEKTSSISDYFEAAKASAGDAGRK